MAEVVVARDVEAMVVSGLNAALTARSDTARVSTRIPNPRPSRLVRVRRRGGPLSSVVVDVPLLLIECWDEDEVDAGDLARLVNGLIVALPGSVDAIASAEILSGPSNDPDPDSTSPRYTSTAQLWVSAAKEST